MALPLFLRFPRVWQQEVVENSERRGDRRIRNRVVLPKQETLSLTILSAAYLT